MKVFIDDARPLPKDYDVRLNSVNQAKKYIAKFWEDIEIISLDHDAGSWAEAGGDYIEILKWLEYQYFVLNKIPPFKFTIHSGNPVGVRNMKAIIDHCGWSYVPYTKEK